MFLKSGVLVLCVIAEILLGIYTYFHFDNLLTRFMFFILTAVLIAAIVIRIAGGMPPANGNASEPAELPKKDEI